MSFFNEPTNEPTLRVRAINPNTGEVSIEQVPISKIVPPTHPVSELTASQLSRVTRLYKKVGYRTDKSLEKWIEGFTYELYPEREIQVWEEMSAAFEAYNKTHQLTFTQQQQVLEKLRLLSIGEELNDSVSLELARLFKKQQASTSGKNPRQSPQPWDNIDYQMLAQLYTEYIERHPVENQDNKHELVVTLIRLMSGNEPSSELGRELLDIWQDLEESELDNEQCFDPDNITDERQKRSKDVVIRPGQANFKSSLMRAYGGCCAITGCSVEPVLEAAHIIPYSGAKSDHPSNGILLRGDIHILFDIHFLSINPDTKKVEILPILKNTHYEKLAGQSLRMPKSKTERPNHKALSKHYQIFSRG